MALGRRRKTETSTATWRKRRKLGKQWLKRIKKAPLKTKRSLLKRARRTALPRLGIPKLSGRRLVRKKRRT